MKVLFQSFYLYFLGIAADLLRWSLEKKITRSLRRGKPISSKRLAVMSDISYALYRQFCSLETDINNNLKFL